MQLFANIKSRFMLLSLTAGTKKKKSVYIQFKTASTLVCLLVTSPPEHRCYPLWRPGSGKDNKTTETQTTTEGGSPRLPVSAQTADEGKSLEADVLLFLLWLRLNTDAGSHQHIHHFTDTFSGHSSAQAEINSTLVSFVCIKLAHTHTCKHMSLRYSEESYSSGYVKLFWSFLFQLGKLVYFCTRSSLHKGFEHVGFKCELAPWGFSVAFESNPTKMDT